MKRQRKLEAERKRMENKFKKLNREQELKSRLLSTEELNLVVNKLRNHRLGTEPLSQDELHEIIGRYNEHKIEKARRKKMQKKQSKEIRNKRRRIKLNNKFEYLNDVLKRVKVEETDRSTASRQILEFDLTLKGYGHSSTHKEYFEIMRQDTIYVLGNHNDSTKTKLIFIL